MKMQPTEDGGFEQVGMPTQAERELGERILSEKVEPGSKASVFLGIELLRKKEGFHTLKELKQQNELFTRQYGNLDGQLLLIEVNYLKRTCFGGPGADLGLVDATGYILGVIDRTLDQREATSARTLVPVAKHVRWQKYATIFDDFSYSENLLYLDILNSFASYGGGAQYRVLVGNMEVQHAISRIELDKQKRGVAQQLILNFWRASKAIGVDTSNDSTVSRNLEEGRKAALREYVQDKIDFASSKTALLQEGALVFGELKNPSPKNHLLLLGLSEEAIAYRAKELAIKLLDL